MRQVAAGHDGRSGATIAAVILLHPVLSATVQDLAHNAGYDAVLLAHVLSVLVGFGAVAAAGGYALALARSGPASESIRRYYQPGVNWAGRVLFLVPIFGIVLVLMSHGQYGYSDHWVGTGLILWAVVATIGELALWPAERRLQVTVGDSGPVTDLRAQCLRVAGMSAAVLVLLIVATVVMVAKP
jgi:hypothetical protein